MDPPAGGERRGNVAQRSAAGDRPVPYRDHGPVGAHPLGAQREVISQRVTPSTAEAVARYLPLGAKATAVRSVPALQRA